MLSRKKSHRRFTSLITCYDRENYIMTEEMAIEYTQSLYIIQRKPFRGTIYFTNIPWSHSIVLSSVMFSHRDWSQNVEQFVQNSNDDFKVVQNHELLRDPAFYIQISKTFVCCVHCSNKFITGKTWLINSHYEYFHWSNAVF